MKRQMDLSEVTDGRTYGLNDMVRADCGDCRGCSACCRGMGTSVILDPMDCFLLTCHLHQSFEKLLSSEKLELNVVDGLVLPNLKMQGKEECCGYLNASGRCEIHALRPGICRLFPLGRLYEGDRFRYILQTRECANRNRAKVKVRKWIDVPDADRYEQYLSDWHAGRRLAQESGRTGETESRTVCLQLLQLFYVQPYAPERDFYEQFYERLERGQNAWK